MINAIIRAIGSTRPPPPPPPARPKEDTIPDAVPDVPPPEPSRPSKPPPNAPSQRKRAQRRHTPPEDRAIVIKDRMTVVDVVGNGLASTGYLGVSIIC